MNSREAAFIAVLKALRQEMFVTDSLSEWQKVINPTKQDFNLAYEIASGTIRMALALDYIAEKLTAKGKLNLKLKEKALLRTAIYQCYFMSKIPLYAIADETVQIAKKYFHKNFISFLNAILRKVNHEIKLPSEKTAEAMSIRHSYPGYFVDKLVADYGLEDAEKILIAGNMAPITMARLRPRFQINQEIFPFLTLLKDKNTSVAIIDKASDLKALGASEEIYIQNATPAHLVSFLAEKTPVPLKILDLCASPGGKLLAAHDIYPKAKLFANDVSENKLKFLSENLSKYHVEAHLTCGLGQEYNFSEKFDLIILDVPCSNTGVLNKRVEARFRLNEAEVDEQVKKQLSLIEHATKLLAENGVIWYLTCSILTDENENVIASACQNFDLEMIACKKILPNENGFDGGYGALIKSSNCFLDRAHREIDRL